MDYMEEAKGYPEGHEYLGKDSVRGDYTDEEKL